MATSSESLVTGHLEDDIRGKLNWRERLFLRLLKRIRGGNIRVQFPSGVLRTVGDRDHPAHLLHIKDDHFFSRVFKGGSVGFGEAYQEGLWTTPDLTALLDLLASNQRDIGLVQRGFSFLTLKMNQLYHAGRRNTLTKSRENIQEHYDLSNDFYKTFLDETMSYSCGCFTDQDDTLEEAQIRKIDRILDQANAREGDYILEIGSGWGGLALCAARRGCRVKTITLSVQQYQYALELFEREGVSKQVEIVMQDYRELKGQYDAVVSCEMIEAVGKEYLSSYFEMIRQSLKPDGRAVLQAITIPDERYDRYCRSCDWIQKHIFPGGHLPCPEAIRGHAETAGLSIENVRAFGGDYAETLARWQVNFNTAVRRVESLGFDAAFQRKWNYYFSYCIAGFDNDLIDVQHVVLAHAKEPA